MFAREAFCLSYQPVELKQFSTSPIQQGLIESSGAVSSSALASDGSLWLLTDVTLWRWYPITGVVQKINPGSNLSLKGQSRVLGTFGDGVYLAIDGQMWRFGTGSGAIDHFSGSWNRSCGNVRFWGEGDFFGVSNDCEVWRVDRYAKSLQLLTQKTWLKPGAADTYSPSCKCLWVANGRRLQRIQNRDDKLKIDDLYEAKSSFSGLSQLGDHVIAWTSYALIVFDAKTGRRLQVVPTTGSRRIVSAAFGPEVHAILFHDGTIEWMAPKTETAWTSRISPMDGMRLQLDPGAAFLLVYAKGVLPTALNLEPLNLTSP